MNILGLARFGAFVLWGACQAQGGWGLKYEVSNNGTTWSSSVVALPNTIVKFRVSSYFDAGTQITTSEGTGNARALNRFTGQQQVAGLVAGDQIQNTVRLMANGNPALVQISGNLIGGTGASSFGANIILVDLPNPPQTSSPILSGEIQIGADYSARNIVISNKQFGSGSTPGLLFYHDASPSKQTGAPAASAGAPTHLNATITLTGDPCPPVAVSAISSNAPVKPSRSAILQATTFVATTFRWTKNGVVVENSARISGATSRLLTIQSPVASDGGVYDLQGWNICLSTDTSGPFTLVVQCAADLTRDNFVDDSDFVVFGAAYDDFACPNAPATCAADLNADGVVDDLDFAIFAVQYNALLCPQ